MDFNRKNFKYIVELLVLAFVLYWLAQNLTIVPLMINQIFNMMAPLIIGILLGFIINIPTAAIENSLLNIPWGKYDKYRVKLKRPLSLLCGLIIVFGIVALVLILVLPELQNTIRLLATNLPSFFSKGEEYINQFLDKHPEISTAVSASNLQIDKLSNILLNRVQNFATQSLNTTVNFLFAVINSFFLFLLGMILAIYGSLCKEQLGFAARKLCYAFMPERKAEKFIEVISFSVETFTRYISAQVMEAMILGSLVFLALTVFAFPYALIISAFVTLCALIPIFGIYISGVLGAFLILIIDPSRVLPFLILLLIIQQFEGNIIYPHVVGNKVGLPPILVIASVILGGRMFGFLGLLLCVPFTSVAYSLIKYNASKRVDSKSIGPEKYAASVNLELLYEQMTEIESSDGEVFRQAQNKRDSLIRYKRLIDKQGNEQELKFMIPVKKRILKFYSKVKVKIFRKQDKKKE